MLNNIDLYSPDGSHPSFLGSYAAGVCFYTTLFQKNPIEIPWNQEWDISESDAEIIHEVVRAVVYDNLEDWNITSNDIDGDGICNILDNCPQNYNPNQEYFNSDNIGDACDGIELAEVFKKKQFLRTINLLGKEGKEKYFQLEIYDDGSVEKKYVIK